jgi:hypothetical protein
MIVASMVGAVALIGISASAGAGEIKRVRCRVEPDLARVQISIDLRDVDQEMIDVMITNSDGDTRTIPDQVPDFEGDVKVEWDSDIALDDPAEGTRGEIEGNFALVGESVTASATGVAPESATCREKSQQHRVMAASPGRRATRHDPGHCVDRQRVRREPSEVPADLIEDTIVDTVGRSRRRDESTPGASARECSRKLERETGLEPAMEGIGNFGCVLAPRPGMET